MTTTDGGRFAGKVAFITGAGGGIGRATAVAFAAEGAAVMITDVTADGARETARLIGQQGGRALATTCDVTRSDDITAALDQTMESFGRLDVAFNNAGVEQPVTPTADITEDVWNRILDINLTAVFLCMQQQIPLLLAGGGGAIVNTRRRVPV
jgi:NAD(P)-dependent dehydrogenase (short-subunit alcohol dehydrogenase family)